MDIALEIKEKLDLYEALLRKWQAKINLVSKNTLDDAWERHFLDSAQLEALLPENAKTLVDFGSGAGFPGLVLAVLRTDIEVHLVESDERKCAFLRNVSRETLTPATVHGIRIENAPVFHADVLTARALADLKLLLEYSLPWFQENPTLVAFFLKGQKAEQEIEQAEEFFHFESELLESATDKSGRIIKVSNLMTV